jgi:hypothetical protein
VDAAPMHGRVAHQSVEAAARQGSAAVEAVWQGRTGRASGDTHRRDFGVQSHVLMYCPLGRTSNRSP